MKDPLVVEYYTDILCIWAWIAQRRIDELNQQLGEQVQLRYLYVDVFGDVEGKMQSQWLDRGLYQGFAEHVQESAGAFETAHVNELIWTQVRPKTSANAHLILKAVEDALGAKASANLAYDIRKAFFVDARDVGDLSVLFDICTEAGISLNELKDSIEAGRAMAMLMADYKRAAQQRIQGSPSYLLDNGRQTLYGNVGYRVLHANIEELIKQPKSEASWC